MKRICIVLLVLSIANIVVFAQNSFVGYEDVKTGFVLEENSVLYKNESVINGFFSYVLISSHNIIVTNNQFDERIKFPIASMGDENKVYLFANEKEDKIFMIDLNECEIGYYDLTAKEIILKAKIDLLKSSILQKEIEN